MLSLTVAHPRQNQEFPVGVDIPVSGTAVGIGGNEPHPIESVKVRVDSESAVEANLAVIPPHPSVTVSFNATIRLNSPGEHQVIVTATDDVGRSVTKAIAVATPGTTHCKAGVVWNNYPQTQSLIPESTCTPESLAGIVAIVREAEAAQKHVHAFGSKWSFSDCAFTSDYVIDTRQLFRAIQTVQRALRPGRSSRVYHVEAGITIRSLYNNLNRLGLALETMGGASGQTLAGAISTGTHGGDKLLAPLADSVLAIHLVGAGGTQFWIEPSSGITDPALLKAHVVPDIDPENIIYDDATFDACLVSLGCMGVIYAVVLRVREAYDLVETTVETTWHAFRQSASTYLNDPGNRFLQILLNPYRDDNWDNFCLLTTRSEAAVTGPVERPRGDVEAAVKNMIFSLTPHAIFMLNHEGLLDDNGLAPEHRLAKIFDVILSHTPDQRHIMVAHYMNIMRASWPTGTFQGSSYSVMDLGYGQVARSSQAGFSIELSFPAILESGKLGFVDFVNDLISLVNDAKATFFAGYVSLRFTGPTRACLGMQQWSKTCSVEISTVQGVQGLPELLTTLFKRGFFHGGGLPHWGQQLDLGVQGHGGVYRQYAQWRQVYAKMSNNFTARTFENALSSRWKLTTPNANDAQFVSQTVPEVMEVGQSQPFIVKMQNTGTTTWTKSGFYRLGSQNPQDNVVWGLNRKNVEKDVLPGATVSFQFTIIAPLQSGTYKFQWRMVQEWVEWFGDLTPEVAIRVVPPRQEQTTVPDVREMSRSIAENNIHAANLVPKFTGATAPNAWVWTQSPEGGTVVDRGSTVTLQLKTGPIL
ncbi:MAG: FAD-binding protein [Chloroflexota bacterium]|nr:FAD-binding protein [Chloroflexota bacterium]